MLPSFPALPVPLLSTVSLLGTVYARTTLKGCTFTDTVTERDEYSIIWYVPETGEICDVPVCGGGLNPFDYDNPACPEYTGTAPYEPSYLEDYDPRAAAVTAEAAVDASVTSAADWTGQGEETGKVVPGDDGSKSMTTTSSRFSSTVATSSPEKTEGTLTSITCSSMASLRPSPKSTSSASDFLDELFSGLGSSNAAAEPTADHQLCSSASTSTASTSTASTSTASISTASTSTASTSTASTSTASTSNNQLYRSRIWWVGYHDWFFNGLGNPKPGDE
ncbi:hypothetical protein BDW66DRAFT_158894 [Aspergillus desertorum]